MNDSDAASAPVTDPLPTPHPVNRGIPMSFCDPRSGTQPCGDSAPPGSSRPPGTPEPSGVSGSSTALGRITQVVPEFAAEMDRLAELHDECLSLGTVLAELAGFVGDAAMRLPFPVEMIGRTMGLLEELLSSYGPEIREEIGISFLANLPILAVTASLPWMGPSTLEVLESMDDAWV